MTSIQPPVRNDHVFQSRDNEINNIFDTVFLGLSKKENEQAVRNHWIISKKSESKITLRPLDHPDVRMPRIKLLINNIQASDHLKNQKVGDMVHERELYAPGCNPD